MKGCGHKVRFLNHQFGQDFDDFNIGLIDSNIQSNSLAVNLERITELVEMHTDGLNLNDSTVAELKKLLSDVRQKVVFARDMIAYPPAPDDAASDQAKPNATESSADDLG